MKHIVLVTAVLAVWTARANADDPPPPTVEKLIEQLGSRSFAEREKATKLLRDRGPAALPALRKVLESKDEEVRKRAEALIPPLEIEEALLPKRVTLKANGESAAAVLADLAKQTGYKLAADGKDDGKKVTADLKDVPFWEAMEKVGLETGRGPRMLGSMTPQRQETTVQLTGLTGRSPFVNVRGPFRLEATWFHEDRDVDFARAGRNQTDDRAISLPCRVSILAEPRLTFLKVRPAKIDEAIDSEGRSLLEPGSSSARQRTRRSEYRNSVLTCPRRVPRAAALFAASRPTSRTSGSEGPARRPNRPSSFVEPFRSGPSSSAVRSS